MSKLAVKLTSLKLMETDELLPEKAKIDVIKTCIFYFNENTVKYADINIFYLILHLKKSKHAV
jgi:hypothetical protein